LICLHVFQAKRDSVELHNHARLPNLPYQLPILKQFSVQSTRLLNNQGLKQ